MCRVALTLVVLLVPVPGRADPVAGPPRQADLVLTGGNIVTVDAQNRIVQALAIHSGRISAVGSEAEVARQIGPATRVVRLAGKVVVPGFIEGHVHSVGVAQGTHGPEYAELSSIAEIQAWIRRRAQALPPGTWMEVPRNDMTRLKERRFPTPAELDAACRTHPVAYESARKWVLNSLGFEKAGLTEGAPKIPGLRVLRDEAGRPRVIEGGGGLIRKFVPYPTCSEEETLAALDRLLRRYNEVGITSIYERASNRRGWQLFRTLAERDPRIRVTLTFRQSMRSADDVARFVRELDFKPGQGDQWVRIGPLKITQDGGIHWGNTNLREPYGEKRARFYVQDNPDYRGDLYNTVEQMRDVFAAAHRLGWQMCVHVTGDAGVDRVLDALEASNQQIPVKGRRFTLLHAYFPRPEALTRCARLGVCVDTQTYLYFKDSDFIAKIYGPDWAERFIGIGDWSRAGIPVAINSDHMIGMDPDHAMNSFNPLLHLGIAVSRRNEQGDIHGARQKIERLNALRMVTSSVAYMGFHENELGSLEVGKLADLAVLDRDYLSCPEEQIRHIKVLATLVGGRVVHGTLP
jgi:predicted amidohydrolase YtcJ